VEVKARKERKEPPMATDVSYILRYHASMDLLVPNTHFSGQMGKFFTPGNGVTRGWCDPAHYDNNKCWPVKKWIRFPSSFRTTPQVITSLSLLDTDKNKNVRTRVFPSSISRYGFNLNIHKWADTLLYIVEASWIACGN
jgi:hypothetical protein